MEKNNKKANTLIKRNNLIILLKKFGFERINLEAVDCLESIVEDTLRNKLNELKEEVTIQGRKTLRKEDVEKVFSKKEENFDI